MALVLYTGWIGLMIDLGKKSHITRLYTAIESSRDALLPQRKHREAMIQQFVGSYYSNNGPMHEVLVNLMNMTAEAYTLGLASNNPRVRVTTTSREQWPFAFKWTHTLNNLIEEIHFAETLQQVVLDAFFTMGVAKVFQADWETVQLDDDVWADPGRPYMGHISFDDFGLDMGVKDTRRCKFMWDEYRVSWESVRDNPDFDKSVLKQLHPTSKHDRGETTVNDISSGALTDDDEYEPMTDLMDVWLPELDKVGVFPRHVQTKPLKLVDAGPEGGPYKTLSFQDVPDNVLPSAPGQNLQGLHLLYNGLARKQARQAKRQKTNPVFRPSGAPDAERLKTHNDGEWVQVGDPTSVNVITQGGVDPSSVAFSIGVMELFDRQAGNLSAMAGLGPQANTLGQEEIIQAAVSRKEAMMQQRVHTFTSEAVSCLGHLMWADEFMNIPLSVPTRPGSPITRDVSWTPELREGDAWQYKFRVEPRSMNYESPEIKLRKLERAMDRLLQFYPIIQAQGGTIDVKQMTRDYAELLSIPELENWIMYATPAMLEQQRQNQGGQDDQGMAPETTRNYVRRNVATGGTPSNRNAVMEQAWLGGGQNTPQQAATLSR